MEFKIFYIFYILAFELYFSEGAKILSIILVEAQSHFTYNNAIMKSLIEAGHEVTIITPFPEQASAENYTSIIDFSKKQKTFVGQAKPLDYVSENAAAFLDLMIGVEQPYCSKLLHLPEIQRILKSNEKLYDVVIVEIAFLYNCYLHVAEKMEVPVIGTVAIRPSTYVDYVIQNPNHPAYIPFELTVPRWNLDHIFGRMVNVYNSLVVAWYTNFVIPPLIEKFHRDHEQELGSLGKYIDLQPDLIFYNDYPSVLPKPSNPNVINIGGIHVKSAKPLPKNIQKFIDEATHGVVLFTFGSVVRAATLSTEKKNAFRDAFAEIPQRVVWKFEEKLDNLSDNVMLLDWLPQQEILAHRKVIAFITHCGLGATNEAIYTATPVVACPLFCDQPDNAGLLQNLGVAVHLDYNDITKESVLKALNSIINDTSYYNNMQKVSAVFKDRPLTPQQSVVYWTEYVIRHGGASHFKNPATRLSLFQYWLLDVAFVAVIILISVLYLIYRVIKILSACYNFTKNAKIPNKPKNKKL